MPPDGLRGRSSLLPAPGRALDLACGWGAVAVWLAQRGFAVDAVDVSPEAVRSGRALAAEAGVGGRRRGAGDGSAPVVADPGVDGAGSRCGAAEPGAGEAGAGEVGAGEVGAGEAGAGEAGAGEVGGVRFLVADLDAGLPVRGPYELVVCQRFRDPALYPALVEALAPGGLLVITVLSSVDEEPGRFRAEPGELLAAFGALEVLAHEEGNGEATLLARRP
jgi:SAM-dependent methyltransferase